MAGERDAESVIAAAEKAATEGDYVRAEEYLREAADLQEEELGPFHPDLANTLNNLGVACEQSGKLDAAEDAYRRAFAIADAVFSPEHPFVVRSAENLRDFCAARGRPLDLPAPLVLEAVPESVQIAPALIAEIPVPDALRAEPVSAPLPVASPSAAIDTTRPSPERPRSVGWVVPVVIVVAIAALVGWLVADRPAVDPAATTPAAVTGAPAAPAPAPATGPQAAAPVPARPAPAAATTAPAATSPTSGQRASASLPANVVSADVCRNFAATGAEWRCEPVGDATTPGALVFVTRVRSPKPATIVHRWYRNDTLMQRVELRINGNPGAGYRTYSRNTVTPGGRGDWRVELLDSGGTILHTHRFVVR